MMNFSENEKFQKELKWFSKKFRSLPDDIKEFKKIVSEIPIGTSKHFAVLYDREDIKIIKARLFCRYLKGSSLRIIYAYHPNKHLIEFLELYFKGDKELEDKERIERYLREICRF